MAIGDVLAALEFFRSFVEERKGKRAVDELLAVRAALSNLYFSNETIDRLQRIQTEEDLGSLKYEAGRTAIRQRDNRQDVRRAFDTLSSIAQNDVVGLKVRRFISEIMNSKREIRQEIELAYFHVMEHGQPAETAQLVEKIKLLNSLLEDVDNELGAFDLLGKHNG